jgi:hypothetical protein
MRTGNNLEAFPTFWVLIVWVQLEAATKSEARRCRNPQARTPAPLAKVKAAWGRAVLTPSRVRRVTDYVSRSTEGNALPPSDALRVDHPRSAGLRLAQPQRVATPATNGFATPAHRLPGFLVS